MYFHIALSQPWIVIEGFGYCGLWLYGWSYLHSGYFGNVLFGGCILGGSVLPPLQASIIDMQTLLGMPAVNVSFILPFICFVVIIVYGHRSYVKREKTVMVNLTR